MSQRDALLRELQLRSDHECCHAVVGGGVFGLPIKKLTLLPDPSILFESPKNIEEKKHLLVATMSGIVHSPRGAKRDAEDVFSMIEELKNLGVNDDPEIYENQAADLLENKNVQAAIKALSAELIKRKTLRGVDVNRIIAKYFKVNKMKKDKTVLVKCLDDECGKAFFVKDEEGELVEFQKCAYGGWVRTIAKSASDNSKKARDLRDCGKLKGPEQCACLRSGHNKGDKIPGECLPPETHAKVEQLKPLAETIEMPDDAVELDSDARMRKDHPIDAADIAARFCASLDNNPQKICKALESDLGREFSELYEKAVQEDRKLRDQYSNIIDLEE